MDLKTTENSRAWIEAFRQNVPELNEAASVEAFRAVLHAIRDRLPLSELAGFGSLLPPTVRGEYYGAWTPHARDFAPDFEEDVRRRLDAAGCQVSASQVIRGAWKVLAERVDEGNLDQVLHLFPAAVSEAPDLPFLISA